MGESSEGSILSKLLRRNRGKSGVSEITSTKVSNGKQIEVPNLTIDAIGTEGTFPDNILSPFMGKTYTNFSQLREDIEKAGFTMTTPDRDDNYAKNRAGVDVFKNGKRVGALTFEASVDLTQGPTTSLNRPQLKSK